MLMNPKTIVVFVFYAIFGVIFFILFYRKTQLKRLSFMSSILFVMVGSQYWEIPVFISALFGFNILSDTLQPLTSLILFFVLVIVTKTGMTGEVVLLLALGPIINLVLLYPIIYKQAFLDTGMDLRLFRVVYILICRTVGLTCLGGALFAGSSLVRVKSKPI